MADERKLSFKTQVDNSDVKAGFNELKREGRAAGEAVAKAGKDGAKGLESIGSSATDSARKVDANARSMVAAIQRTTAEMQAGTKASEKYYQALAAQRGINFEQLKPYVRQLEEAIRQLEEATAAQNRYKDSLDGLKSLGAAAAGFAALAASAAAVNFVATVRGALDAADAVGKLSQRTGIATEQLSQLQFAAKLSGVGSESLTTSLRKLNVSLSEAQSGDRSKIEVFKVLGVSLRDAAGNATTADKALLQIADTFAKAKDGAGKTALAVEVLGKAGDEMIPLLNGGSKAVKELMDRADKLGLTIGTDFSDKAQEFNDNLTILSATSQALGISMASDLLPALNAIVLKMIEGTEAGGRLRGIMAGLDELGNQLFDWEGNAQRKALKRLQGEIATTEKTVSGLVASSNQNMFAQAKLDEAEARLRKLREELTKTSAAYFNLTSEGRGTTPGFRDPRQLGPVASIAVQTNGLNELKVPAKPDGTAASQYDTLILRIKERIALADEEVRAGRALSEAEKFEAKIVEELNSAKSKLTATEKQAILVMLDSAKKRELQLQVARSEIAQAQEIAKARQEARNKDYADSAAGLKAIEEEAQRSIKTIEDQVSALEFEAEATEVARAKNISLAEAIQLVTIARLRERQAMTTEGAEAWQNIEREIEARQRLASQIGTKSTRDEWQRTADYVQETLTDALARGFESGKGFARSLRDSLKEMFSRLVLRPIVRAIVSPAAAGVSSMLGMSNAAAGTADAMGGAGTAGLTAAGSMLLNGKLWLSNFGDQVALGVGKVGASLINSNLGSGIDELGASMIEGAQAAGQFAQVAGNAIGYISAISAAAEGKWGQAAGTAIGTFFGGPIGAFIGGEIGKFVDEFFGGGGGPKVGAYFGAATANPEGRFVGEEMTPGAIAQIQKTVEGIGAAYIDALRATGGTGVASFGLGISADPEGDAKTFLQTTVRDAVGTAIFSAVDLNVGRSEEDLQKSIQEYSARAVLAALQASSLPENIRDYLKKLDPLTGSGADIEKALSIAKGVGAFTQSLDALGSTFSNITSLSVESITRLADFAGGLEAFSAALGTYYTNFYSAEEQRQRIAQNISDGISKADAEQALAPYNLTAETILRMSRQDFRLLVESVKELDTAAGSQLYATLIKLSGAFASITAIAEQAPGDAIASTIEQTISGLDDLIRGLTTTVDSLEATASRLRTFATNVREFRDSLLLGNLSPLTPAQRYAAASEQFNSTAAGAQSGDPVAQANLQNAARQFLEASQAFNASGSGYVSDFAQVQAALTTIAAGADASATIADQQLAAARQELASAEIQREIARQQLDELKGIKSALERMNFGTAGMTAAQTQAMALYTSVGVTSPDTEGLAYWSNLLASGMTLAEVTARFMESVKAVRGYASGGFASGLSLVGELGPELVDFSTPARVYTADQTAAMFSGGRDLSEKIEALVKEVATLREQHFEGTQALIRANYDSNAIAAERVVAGTANTSERSAWKRQLANEAVPA